jgi:hypothetical protein
VIDHDQPLAEIPFLEELALVVRKNKGLPILDISTENLHKRFFEEISEDPPNISMELVNKWLDSADMFIDLGWRSNPTFYKSIPDRSFRRLDIYDKDYRKLFEEKNKKLILLGYPTIDLAKYLSIEHTPLYNAYFSALNVNYYDMKKTAAIIDSIIKKQLALKVETMENSIVFELVSSGKSYYGDMQSDHIITLPTGFWTQPLDMNTLNGTFFTQQIYHENHVWKNVHLSFENGKITLVDTDTDQSAVNFLKTLLFDNIETVSINIGINHAIKEKCFYYLYDMIKYKHVSLVFQTKKGTIIALSENAVISTRDSKNILLEVF